MKEMKIKSIKSSWRQDYNLEDQLLSPIYIEFLRILEDMVEFNFSKSHKEFTLNYLPTESKNTLLQTIKITQQYGYQTSARTSLLEMPGRSDNEAM